MAAGFIHSTLHFTFNDALTTAIQAGRVGIRCLTLRPLCARFAETQFVAETRLILVQTCRYQLIKLNNYTEKYGSRYLSRWQHIGYQSNQL